MVNVIGTGYIGLPTALMLATNGVEVVGTDKNKTLINRLNNGELTFNEEGLGDLFEKAITAGIRFSSEYQQCNFYIISVPTPYLKKDKKIDASYIVDAVINVLEVCDENSIIVIESTVSPGTIDKFIRPLIKNYKVNIAHAPERIIPGNMIYELNNNSRTIGADSYEIAEKVKHIYESFCKGEIVSTDIRTAEMSKVVENTFRDINIAFANELAKICRADGMDVYEIIRIANMHPRVNILNPGPGVGGHCISVDPWFLVGDYPGLANLILSARKINDSMPEFVLSRINSIMMENNITDNNRVGLYGLTYKENVNDIRESPTLQLLECMKTHLAKGLKIYDPEVQDDVVENQLHSFNEFLDSIDMVVIMVAHNEIIDNMKMLNDKIILDTKNICTIDGCYKL